MGWSDGGWTQDSGSAGGLSDSSVMCQIYYLSRISAAVRTATGEFSGYWSETRRLVQVGILRVKAPSCSSFIVSPSLMPRAAKFIGVASEESGSELVRK
jgi:hypothetical protein